MTKKNIGMKKKMNIINLKINIFIVMRIKKEENQGIDLERNNTIKMIEKKEKKEMKMIDLTKSTKQVNHN